MAGMMAVQVGFYEKKITTCETTKKAEQVNFRLIILGFFVHVHGDEITCSAFSDFQAVYCGNGGKYVRLNEKFGFPFLLTFFKRKMMTFSCAPKPLRVLGSVQVKDSATINQINALITWEPSIL